MAYSADGSAVIAWGRYDGARYVAQAVIRNADGTLGSIRTLATSDQPLGGPKAAIDADGNALLAWTRWDGTDFRVQARTLPPVGALGLTQSLSNAGQDASAPELAVNQDGHGVIAWTRFDGNNYRVEGRTMATTNIAGVGDPELVSDDLQDAREADVGINGDGDAVFVWERYDSADTLIMSRTLRENGSLDAVQTLSVLGASTQDPDIAVNEAGDAAFAWTRWDGQRDRVGGLVDLASSLPGSSQWLSAVGQTAVDARAAIDETGDAIFAWKRWDGDDWRIQSARLPAGGVLDAAETHSADGEGASDPELAIETGGTAAIAWSRWDGAVHRVQVRGLLAGGPRGRRDLALRGRHRSRIPRGRRPAGRQDHAGLAGLRRQRQPDRILGRLAVHAAGRHRARAPRRRGHPPLTVARRGRCTRPRHRLAECVPLRR